MPRLAFVVVSLIVFVGCSKDNPGYCPSGINASGTDCVDGGTGGPCKSRDQCTGTPNFPACDLMENGGTCVVCTTTDHALCTGLTPHCEDHACVACVDDNDCGAPGIGVCLPTGDCADPTHIIYAASNGTMNTCGIDNPCTLETALNLVKAAPGKNVIKLNTAGTYVAEMNNFIVDVDAAIGLTIDARNVTFHHNSSGPIFTVKDGKGMTILGGTIEGATGNGPDDGGIHCGNSNATLAAYGTTIQMSEGPGITATNCKLTLSRSRIMSNKGGGITVANGTFVIVGNIFLGNGDAGSQNPGVTISTTATNTNRLEFNTVTNNVTMTGTVTAGLDCKAGAGFTASHNIVWNNTIGGDMSKAQIANTCLHTSSAIGPMAAPGAGNISDPPLLSADGHLNPGSPAGQKAEVGTDLSGLAARDIDNERRVAPADLGADQLPRP